MELQFVDAKKLSEMDLPPKAALLRMADEPSLLASAKSGFPEMALDLIFNDSIDSYGMVRAPDRQDARKILEFFDQSEKSGMEWFICACQAGKGRSQAVVAALGKKQGKNCDEILANGTYSPRLYKLLMAELGQPVVEPLVSVVVRLKYDADRIDAFLLSMERQRYENWEVIAVTDGPNDDVTKLWAFVCHDPRLRTVQTPVPKGRWGHPYRQLGIDHADGKYISLQNDDNYCCPGWLEQMVLALEMHQADLAACYILHSYCGWEVAPGGSDLCSWVARTDFIRRHPWNGDSFTYDAEYLAGLDPKARYVEVTRPLVCKN